MNTYEVYIPIDVSGPIRTGKTINVQRYNNQNPVLFFQLFDKGRSTMLDDVSEVSIAFTNTNNESVRGSGNLQIVNPHRATISYELSNDDITMSGITTVTLGIKTTSSFFTVQSTVFVQDMNKDLYELLTGSNSSSSSSSCSGNCSNCKNCDCGFPCKHFSIYCRSCRRCKFAWCHNTLPKPVNFCDIKVCNRPIQTIIIKDFSNNPDYERAYLPMVIDSDGILNITIGSNTYKCDVGKDGAVYLIDKSIKPPNGLLGLYMDGKGNLYYKIDEKYDDDDNNSDDDSNDNNSDGNSCNCACVEEVEVIIGTL